MHLQTFHEEQNSQYNQVKRDIYGIHIVPWNPIHKFHLFDLAIPIDQTPIAGMDKLHNYCVELCAIIHTSYTSSHNCFCLSVVQFLPHGAITGQNNTLYYTSVAWDLIIILSFALSLVLSFPSCTLTQIMHKTVSAYENTSCSSKPYMKTWFICWHTVTGLIGPDNLFVNRHQLSIIWYLTKNLIATAAQYLNNNEENIIKSVKLEGHTCNSKKLIYDTKIAFDYKGLQRQCNHFKSCHLNLSTQCFSMWHYIPFVVSK